MDMSVTGEYSCCSISSRYILSTLIIDAVRHAVLIVSSPSPFFFLFLSLPGQFILFICSSGLGNVFMHIICQCSQCLHWLLSWSMSKQINLVQCGTHSHSTHRPRLQASSLESKTTNRMIGLNLSIQRIKKNWAYWVDYNGHFQIKQDKRMQIKVMEWIDKRNGTYLKIIWSKAIICL